VREHPIVKIVVVDDEPPARMRLSSIIEELGLGEVVAQAGNGRAALEAVEQAGAQIVLMDIRMPGMDGLEAARHLGKLEAPPAVIFTTAYEEHALAAFEANAVDYLLKPIRKERLAGALERARSLTRAQLEALELDHCGPKARTHLSATLQGNLRLVPVGEVRFLRAEHKYVTARHGQGELVLDEPLTQLEEEFGDRFLRVHRNALVAVEHVRGLSREADGRTCVMLAGVDERVEVSRRLLAAVRKVLKASA
jgi:two-component system response regulator AlgR